MRDTHISHFYAQTMYDVMTRQLWNKTYTCVLTCEHNYIYMYLHIHQYIGYNSIALTFPYNCFRSIIPKIISKIGTHTLYALAALHSEAILQ